MGFVKLGAYLLSVVSMERVKSSLSELGDRQKRRRIAETVQRELENCSDEESVQPSTHADVCTSPASPEVGTGESSGEVQCQQASEVGSVDDDDDFSLNDPLDDLEWDSVSDVDERQDTATERNVDQLPKGAEVSSALASKLADWALSSNTPASHLTRLLKLLRPYHPDLPADARTLLKTLRTAEVAQMGSGFYHYF